MAKLDRRTLKFLEALGAKLRAARQKQGVSQIRLYRATQIDRRNIIRYEKGRLNITIETLLRMADALGIEMQIEFKAIGKPVAKARGEE